MNKRRLKIPIGILLVALLLTPLGFIWAMTSMELNQYAPMDVPAVDIKSYGTPYEMVRRDMKEFITIKGSWVSSERFFMELPKLKNPYAARMIISSGEYIETDQIIGYSPDGKTEIKATVSGVVCGIFMGDFSYLMMESADKLYLSCNASAELLKIFKRPSLELCTEQGETVEVIKINPISNPDGTTKVLLQLGGGVYGGSVETLKLYTGKVYTQALVVSSKCLFKLNNDPNQWYVRQVDSEGNVIGNREVLVGFTDGDYTCVTGLEEGILLDSGYAAIMGDK